MRGRCRQLCHTQVSLLLGQLHSAAGLVAPVLAHGWPTVGASCSTSLLLAASPPVTRDHMVCHHHGQLVPDTTLKSLHVSAVQCQS